MQRHERGFTLIEVLIVISLVVAFSLLFAEPLYTRVQPNAKKDLCDSYKTQVLAVWEVYRIKHQIPEGTAPSDVIDVDGNPAPVRVTDLDGYGLRAGFRCPAQGEFEFRPGTTTVECSVHDSAS